MYLEHLPVIPTALTEQDFFSAGLDLPFLSDVRCSVLDVLLSSILLIDLVWLKLL